MEEIGNILACMRCGSSNLSAFRGTHGVRGHYLSLGDNQYLCGDCGYLGVPLIFDSEENRLKHAEAQKKRRVFDITRESRRTQEKEASSSVITTDSGISQDVIFWLGILALMLLFLVGYI